MKWNAKEVLKMNKMNKVKKLVIVALLIALHIVLKTYVSIDITDKIRINPSFLVIAINGALFGPLTAGLSGVIVDFISLAIKPMGGYFPGFTITAFLSGAVYGFFLHREKISIINILLAAGIVTFFNNLILNTFWLQLLTGVPFSVNFKIRLPIEGILFIIKSVVLVTVFPRLIKEVKRELNKSGRSWSENGTH